MAKTKVELMAARRLPNPITYTQTIATLNKMILGKQFKKDQKLVNDFFENAESDVKKALAV